jgi:glycerol-3-phosphate acyltransferase PlsY
MLALTYSLILLVSYLLGSIPSGFLVARARGVDLRAVGSGNIGATNAMRVLGKPLGIFVLLADAAKGALACAFVPALAARVTAMPLPGDWPVIAAGVAAILGHNFTCWLRFKGGKGIATSAGVLLVLMPTALGICLAIWLVVVALGRIVSLASVLAAAALPFVVWLLGRSTPLVIVAAGLGLLAIYRHRANIQRLLKGTEPRLGARSNSSKEKAS